MSEELKQHYNFRTMDKRTIMESMKEHLCRRYDLNEVTFTEIAKRTKHYFITCVLRTLVDRYTIAFTDLLYTLYTHYKIVLLLEEDQFIDDMI